MALTELLENGALSFNCVIVVFFLAVVVGNLIINRYGQGLNHIPGPLSQSITQFLRAYQVWKGDIHTTDFSLHRKYGKVVRIGPRLLSVSDPNEINSIYGITTKFHKVNRRRMHCRIVPAVLIQVDSRPFMTRRHRTMKRASSPTRSSSRIRLCTVE